MPSGREGLSPVTFPMMSFLAEFFGMYFTGIAPGFMVEVADPSIGYTKCAAKLHRSGPSTCRAKVATLGKFFAFSQNDLWLFSIQNACRCGTISMCDDRIATLLSRLVSEGRPLASDL